MREVLIDVLREHSFSNAYRTPEDVKLQKASIVIGVVAAVIFILCVAMVAVTLHISPEIDKWAGASKCRIR